MATSSTANQRVFKHTSHQEPYECLKRRVHTIISIDHLSQQFDDHPRDEILALNDQKCLAKLYSDHDLKDLFITSPVTEDEDFGGIINSIYSTLYILKDPAYKVRTETTLIIAGHGVHRNYISNIPCESVAHPFWRDLRLSHSDDPSEVRQRELYLKEFYRNCHEAGVGCTANGFVGGEVDIHQRGYIGVIGVLALWCWHNKMNNVGHHLVIVADTCFSGMWGSTLEKIMTISDNQSLSNYRKILCVNHVTIQCAGGKSEVVRGGVFTRLWCSLNMITKTEKVKLRESSILSQNPMYVSSSPTRPSWKVFSDANSFHEYALSN